MGSVSKVCLGQSLKSEKRLATNFETTVDWTTTVAETTLAAIDTEADTLLESEAFTTQTEFDALNRPTLITQPGGSQHKPTYNEDGLLEKMEVQLQHESAFTEYVENIDYDANSLTLAIDKPLAQAIGIVEAIPNCTSGANPLF